MCKVQPLNGKATAAYSNGTTTHYAGVYCTSAILCIDQAIIELASSWWLSSCRLEQLNTDNNALTSRLILPKQFTSKSDFAIFTGEVRLRNFHIGCASGANAAPIASVLLGVLLRCSLSHYVDQ